MNNVEKTPLVRIITLGCAKNEVDSDNMRAALRAAGYRVDVPVGEGHELPNAIIVNTCSFITEATQESVDTVLDVAARFEEGVAAEGDGRPALIVCGCMPSRYGDELAEAMPEADAFVNVADEGMIVQIVSDLLGWEPHGDASGDALRPGSQRTVREPFAYVKISDGCDRFCSFCTIPYIRGRYRSRTAGEILAEVDWLVAQGVREIVLIGQDTGVWGDDFTLPQQFAPLDEAALAALMEQIATRHPDTWLRVMYLQPKRVDGRLIEVMARYGNVCSYLDIPLQHASAKVIAEMNREGDAESYLALIRRVREELPEVTLRTTVIAGFPGETDEEAEELVRFMEEAAFDFAGVFEYSREEGTPAGERADQILEEVAVERAQRVRDIIEQAGCASAAARVGEVHEVLVCGIADVDDEFGEGPALGADDVAGAQAVRLWGRARFQAPEVDSVIYFEGTPDLRGSIVPVRIVDAIGYDLEGEVAHGELAL